MWHDNGYTLMTTAVVYDTRVKEEAVLMFERVYLKLGGGICICGWLFGI